jgi:hypothetical protein
LDADLELFELSLMKKDISKQTELKSKILAKDNTPERPLLLDTEMEIATYDDIKEAFAANPQFFNALTNIKNVTANTKIISKIDAYFSYIQDSIIMDTIFYYPVEKSGNIFDETPKENVLTENYITIYPNPSQGKVNFDFQNVPDGKMVIQIFDLTGKNVYSNNYENTNGEIVDLSNLKKGMYLVKVLIDNQIVEVQKLNMK